jgi:predicted metal-dependent enzyme (double-stranded beta helix superfamily)
MKFDVDHFVARCIEAARGSNDPVYAVKGVMEAALRDSSSVLTALPATGPDEILLHQSDDLTIYRVICYPGMQYPPHEHGLAALIGLYSGAETNLLYARRAEDPDKVYAIGRLDIKAPQVRALRPEVIHAVSNSRNEPSAAIHVYMGNLECQHRHLWNLEGEGELTFNEQMYFNRARRAGLSIVA